MIRIVLFDAVGTLIHPDPPVDVAYLQVAREHGSPLERSDIKLRFREALARRSSGYETSETQERERWREIVAEVLDQLDDSDQAFERLWEHFARADNWALFDDVQPTWSQLRGKGLLLGIASNFDRRLEQICRDINPLDTADFRFCSSLVGYAKPAREFYEQVADSLDVQPEEILLVGDNEQCDYQGPKQAGWNALHLRRDGARDVQAIQSLTEIVEYVG